MGKERKRWLIKAEDGQISGPFTIDQVIHRIEEGEFSGEEYVSIYPGGRWHIMSQEPHFYDSLLDSLAQESTGSTQSEKIVLEEIPQPDEQTAQTEGKQTRDVQVDEILSGIGSTRTIGPDEEGEKTEFIERSLIESENSYGGEGTTGGDAPETDGSPGSGKSERARKSKSQSKKKRKRKSKRKRSSREDHSVIELVNLDADTFGGRLKQVFKLLILAAVLIGGLGVYFALDEKGVGAQDRIHLVPLKITKGAKPLPKEKLVRLFRSGLNEFYKSTRSSYERAQNYWIQAIEGAPDQIDLWPWLCMAYYELWPYAHQDSKDSKVITQVAQQISQIDPVGPEGGICRSVKLLIEGKIIDANGVISIVLDTYDQQGAPPVLFFYLSAKILSKKNNYSSAVNYVTSVNAEVPNWLGAIEEWADILVKMNKPNLAARRYRQIIQANSGHKMARLHLGILEYRNFRQSDGAFNMLTLALNMSEGAISSVESEAYLILAEINIKKGYRGRALKAAQKAYALNSRNIVAKNLILQIDGQSGLSQVKLKDQQLVFEGDQFREEGSCTSAIGFYQQAYERNKKNGVAARKAGECFWEMSLTANAFRWLNLAIKAEPDVVDSYVVLADFYSQRFDFLSASRVLRKAQRVLPNSHEVYRGMAILEFRRENPVQAIEFGKKAIKKYEGDVESHLILAKAYLMMSNYQDSYSAVTRAVELDPNNRRAQVVYGKALAGLEGVETGVDYYTKLVTAYPTITDYRLALGQLLLEDEQFDRAEKLFKGVVQYNPREKKALLGLGKISAFHKNYQKASDYYLDAAAVDPADLGPVFEAGLLLLTTGKPGKAIKKFETVAKGNKKYPLVFYHIGKAALALNDPATAIKQAKAQLRINPNRPEPYLLSAEAHAHKKLKEYSRCSRDYQRALKFLEPGAGIYVKMSKCYRLTGNYDVAKSMLIQATKVENGFAPIYREFGWLAIAKEEFEQAQRFFAQYFELDPSASDRGQIEAQLNRAFSGQ